MGGQGSGPRPSSERAIRDEKIIEEYHVCALTLAEVGQKHGISRERVRQILTTAAEKHPELEKGTRGAKARYCKQCGRVFYRKRIEFYSVFYCSRRCSARAKRKKWEAVRVVLTCSYCEKPFYRRNGEVRAAERCKVSERVYCSRECLYLDRSS